MSQLADILRSRYGGMVWDTAGDPSLEGQPMPGVQKAPDVSGLQWFGGTSGWPDLFQQPQAMTFQPQGMLDILKPSSPAPNNYGMAGYSGNDMQPPPVVGLPSSAAPVPHSRPIKPDTYTIRKGDTLTSIAKRLGTTVKALAAKNGIKNVNKIKAGATLKL